MQKSEEQRGKSEENCAKHSFFGLPCRPERGLLAWDARCWNFFSRFTFHLSHKKSNDESKLFPLSSSLFPNNAPHPYFLMFGEPHIENRSQPLKGGGYARKPKNKPFNLSTHQLINFFSNFTFHLSHKKANDGSKLFPFSSSLFPKSKPKLAFTLAEVLIVLGIIGIVAEITIPDIISSTEKSMYETSIKKVGTEIPQFFKTYMADTGCSDLICTGLFDDTSGTAWQTKAEAVVSKYMKVIKFCDGTNNDTSCQENVKYLKDSGITNSLFTSTATGRYVGRIVFETADGMTFTLGTGGCQSSSYADNSQFKIDCAYINVDINGQKGPNTAGKDVFGNLRINELGDIYPIYGVQYALANDANGTSGASYWRNDPSQCGTAGYKINNDTQSSISGVNCLARIIENGWRMDYLP